MKWHTYIHLIIKIILLYIPLFSAAFAADLFQVQLQPEWKNLDTDTNNLVDGAWVLVGNITFTKKAKEPIHLDKIVLCWQGNPIEQLCGSLFKQSPHHTFLPIEDYVVCDGKWSKKKQQLTLQFAEQQRLGHVSTFYLVLVVPSALQPVVQAGSFSLVQESLPDSFQHKKNITT